MLLSLFVIANVILIIGLVGIIYNYKHFFLTLLSIEIMYIGATLCFLTISADTQTVLGQNLSLIYLILATVESVVGLGILIILYRTGKTVNSEDYQTLRG